ncbi:MAG: tRNA (adenosine(37)-N6)-threonylcarbamoyltransferase complex transferase subunit TsaD [Bacteroidota bacterium]
MNILTLGIESSCDDTSAAVLLNNKLLANVIANQKVHEQFGGVVPELASRAHQQNIIPVVDTALKEAGVKKSELTAIAYTRGPGLLGSLLIGSTFAKTMSLGLGIPLIEVDHLEAHILAHFIQYDKEISEPSFPFLCLLVSGGHTQIMLVKDYFQMELIGQTIDDAAGEAFDKAAKILGLPYPGGPLIDKYAALGDHKFYNFPRPQIKNLDFSFSGLKTSFLYYIRDNLKINSDFINANLNDLCASMQFAIVKTLMHKIELAIKQTGVKQIALAGGVSANSALRKALIELGTLKGWKVFIPPFQFTTDNAAMIAITGYLKYKKGDYSTIEQSPYSNSKY